MPAITPESLTNFLLQIPENRIFRNGYTRIIYHINPMKQKQNATKSESIQNPGKKDMN
jgi:hypothetical protein